MKALKPFAIALIPLLHIIYAVIWKLESENYLLYLLENWTDEKIFFKLIRHMLNLIIQYGFTALAVIWFISKEKAHKEKVYQLLRYAYVVSFVFYLPLLVNYLTYTNQYINTQAAVLTLVRIAFNIFIFIVLLTVRATTHIPRINLQNYELVAYTSGGHRFLHYVVDVVFIFSITSYNEEILAARISPIASYYLSQLLFLLSLFFYYFYSEAVFRQTLGKILTGSCVVATNTEMNNSRALVRTFSRLIPFDRFSFLFGANWHDKASRTTVVHSYSWENVTFDGDESIQAQ